MSPPGLRDISGEQWLFGVFRAADSSYSAIQETVNVQRGSESGNNQLNSFLQGGEGRRCLVFHVVPLKRGRRLCRLMFLALTLVFNDSSSAHIFTSIGLLKWVLPEELKPTDGGEDVRNGVENSPSSSCSDYCACYQSQ